MESPPYCFGALRIVSITPANCKNWQELSDWRNWPFFWNGIGYNQSCLNPNGVSGASARQYSGDDPGCPIEFKEGFVKWTRTRSRDGLCWPAPWCG